MSLTRRPFVVVVEDFRLAPYEVTQAEYRAAMGDNPSVHQDVTLPIENVTWFQAVAYCNALSQQSIGAGSERSEHAGEARVGNNGGQSGRL